MASGATKHLRTTAVVDIIELDSDALGGLAQEILLQAVAFRTQSLICPDHVQVIYVHRDDGKRITKPHDKHVRSNETFRKSFLTRWISI